MLVGGRRDFIVCYILADIHLDLTRAGVIRRSYALFCHLDLLILLSRLVLGQEIGQLHMCFLSDDILLSLTVACKDLISTLPLELVLHNLHLLLNGVSLIVAARVSSTLILE